jgi:hypothetical protein
MVNAVQSLSERLLERKDSGRGVPGIDKRPENAVEGRLKGSKTH